MDSTFRTIFKPSAWFSNVRSDLLAGAVVALALIPEAIALNEDSETLLDRLAVHRQSDSAGELPMH